VIDRNTKQSTLLNIVMKTKIASITKEVVDLTNTLKMVQQYDDKEKNMIEDMIVTFRKDYKDAKAGIDGVYSSEQVRTRHALSGRGERAGGHCAEALPGLCERV